MISAKYEKEYKYCPLYCMYRDRSGSCNFRVPLTTSEIGSHPLTVANPARGQLNREDGYFPGLARRIRQFRPASACSFPYSG